ncbi:protein-glutamine gamma-glutamyltransferase 5 [Gouania willdenowi]|uniref:protein-glutamine gamma-glutamyltransferase n=1 Tax=Gouania willdenowi TaxID=441366 RepID=A0A8C5E1B4_GOUWI|nr:protein-glutamine gamma-glutamyltransferase 5-like [Gouania willdenowi]
MAAQTKPSFFKEVDLKCRDNNFAHHTNEITEEKLIVRRGQPFLITVRLTQAFNPDVEPLTFSAQTGTDPQQELGTLSLFGIPENVKRSMSAKAVWEAKLLMNSSLLKGALTLNITPPADCPIGKYNLTITYKEEEFKVVVVVLFNPWCTDDSVYLISELKKLEYVLSEQGVIYKGTTDYILSEDWDFGQFEENMVDICFLLLDKSLSFQKDPSADAAARCDPVHVSRVISSMINSEDVQGVLKGRWDGDYRDGIFPSHWTGSYVILNRWFQSGGQEVKYGQCWVFACVMCSVMRLLGIPCRAVTNYNSAHDVDRNLVIDTFHSVHGVESRPSPDSIWNFHIWVECWFKRPDLAEHGNYDGWQVLDPTPQETSGGVFRCGPAPVKAIRKGKTHLQYDTPFVFAEVNADCIDWLILSDGDVDKWRLFSDTKKIGQNISTNYAGVKYRKDITENYKPQEGTPEERMVFMHAITRDYSRGDGPEPNYDDETESETEEEEVEQPLTILTTADVAPAVPDVTGGFQEVNQPINGSDVYLKLQLRTRSLKAEVVVIDISVQAMRHNGSPAALIQEEEVTKTLPPGEEFFMDVVIPYMVYHEHMVDNNVMRIQAVVSEKETPDQPFLTQFDVVLLDPPMSIAVPSLAKINERVMAEVSFENPVDETLTDCSLTVSGSGLLKEEFVVKLPDLKPDNKVRIKVFFYPYKKGNRLLMADLDCSGFRDIKASRPITVTP